MCTELRDGRNRRYVEIRCHGDLISSTHAKSAKRQHQRRTPATHSYRVRKPHPCSDISFKRINLLIRCEYAPPENTSDSVV
jgi:hypothetical protein